MMTILSYTIPQTTKKNTKEVTKIKARDLLKEVNKSKRFLPSDLEDVEVVITNNSRGITFYFFKDEEIMHKFKITDRR